MPTTIDNTFLAEENLELLKHRIKDNSAKLYEYQKLHDGIVSINEGAGLFIEKKLKRHGINSIEDFYKERQKPENKYNEAIAVALVGLFLGIAAALISYYYDEGSSS